MACLNPERVCTYNNTHGTFSQSVILYRIDPVVMLSPLKVVAACLAICQGMTETTLTNGQGKRATQSTRIGHLEPNQAICHSVDISTGEELSALVENNKYVIVNFYSPLAVCVGAAVPAYCSLTNQAEVTMNDLAKVIIDKPISIFSLDNLTDCMYIL